MEKAIDIKKLRETLCMTQAEFGAAIGVDQSTVSLWEAGMRPRKPALKLISMLAGGAAIPLDASKRPTREVA